MGAARRGARYWSGNLVLGWVDRFLLPCSCFRTNAPHPVAHLRMVDPWLGAEYVFLVVVTSCFGLDFALVRWLPIEWKALGLGGFWRKKLRSSTQPPAIAG